MPDSKNQFHKNYACQKMAFYIFRDNRSLNDQNLILADIADSSQIKGITFYRGNQFLLI